MKYNSSMSTLPISASMGEGGEREMGKEEICNGAELHHVLLDTCPLIALSTKKKENKKKKLLGHLRMMTL